MLNAKNMVDVQLLLMLNTLAEKAPEEFAALKKVAEKKAAKKPAKKIAAVKPTI